MTYLIIPAVPVPQPRQRHALIAGHATNYTPANSTVNAFKATVRRTWQDFVGDVAPLEGPVYLGVDFVLPCPASRRRKRDSGHRIWCPVRPDLDNLLKSLKDALKGLAWHDDGQVVQVRATKTFSADCEQPKVELHVLPAKPIAEEVTDGTMS